MVNSVISRKIKSPWKTNFRLLLVIVVLGILSFFGLKILTSMKNKELKEYELQKTKSLDIIKKKFGNDEMYEKFNYSKNIEKEYHTMPWKERINLIVDKIKELKSMSYDGSNAIILSDFNVTLDKLSLKGKVSNMILLYRSSKNRHFKSIIEMFQDLDFVKDVKIRTYNTDGDMIEFILDANLTLADGNVSK